MRGGPGASAGEPPGDPGEGPAGPRNAGTSTSQAVHRGLGLDGASSSYVDIQGGPAGREADPIANWLMAMGRRAATAPARSHSRAWSQHEPLTVEQRPALQNLPGGWSEPGTPDRRSSTSARSLHAAGGDVARACWTAVRADGLQRSRWRARPLGPVPFMHRASRLRKSDGAALRRGGLDSTHVSMGVHHAGVVRQPLQVEASSIPCPGTRRASFKL